MAKSGNQVHFRAIAALTVLLFGGWSGALLAGSWERELVYGLSGQENSRLVGARLSNSGLNLGIWIFVASLIEEFCYCLRSGDLL